MAKNFFGRYSLAILLAVAVLSPFIFVGAFRAIRSNTNKVEDWLPDSFPETHDLEWFRRYFVGDQFVVVSWEGCELGDQPGTPNGRPDDPRIERLARILVPGEGDPQTKASTSGFFKSVATGRRLLEELTSDPLNVHYDEAVDRLRGWLIGPDGRQSCVVVTLSQLGVDNMRAAIGLGTNGLLRVARKQGVLIDAIRGAGLNPDLVHLGGPPVDNVAIDEEGEKTLLRLAGLSGLLGLGLAWTSFRSWKLTLIVFAAGVLSAALALALVWMTGETMDAVMMSMPALVYVLAVSGSVHLIHYYREEVIEHGLEGAVGRAIRLGWKPTMLCNVTTALGLFSLHVSKLVPIRKFGDYSALGVIAMLVVLFVYLPAALQLWPWKPPKDASAAGNPAKPNHRSAAVDEHVFAADPYWLAIARFIVRNHALVAIACALLVAGVGLGVTRIKTSIQLLELFDAKARILADYAWLEKNLGRLVPMELIVKFQPETLSRRVDEPQATGGEAASPAPGEARSLTFLERLETVALIQAEISEEFGPQGRNLLGRSMSALTFAPSIPDTSSSPFAIARRKAVNRRMEHSRSQYERLGYLRSTDEGAELWRVSLRVGAFQGVDYGQFMQELQSVVEPVLVAQQAREDVLRELMAGRGGSGYAGARVQVVGRDLGGVTRRGPEKGGRDRPAVFRDALAALLDRAGLRISVEDRPASLPGGANSRGAEHTLFDGTVLIGDVSEDDERIAREASAVVVDLRRISRELHELDARGLNPSVGHVNQEDSRPVMVTYTGVVPIVYKAQRMLLGDLMESTTWSFSSITPVLMLVTWSIPAGMVAMLPNVLPVLVIFGGMGWLGIKVDIGSMMSASIALGVAVDDTIHFLSWFRRDYAELGERRPAILSAYKRCATPTMQAALISGLGLSVFAFSSFMPTQRFGVLMLSILCAGVVAELVMFPSLLAGPLGHVYRPRKRSPRDGHLDAGQGQEPFSDGPHFEAAAARNAMHPAGERD